MAERSTPNPPGSAPCSHFGDLVSEAVTAENPQPEQRCSDCGQVVIPTVLLNGAERKVVDLMAALLESVKRARHGS